MKRRRIAAAVSLIAIAGLCLFGGCGTKETFTVSGNEEGTSVSEPEVLPEEETDITEPEISAAEEPPVLQVTDPLSGTSEEFLVQSSAYEWNGMIACGMAPWDYAYQKGIYLDIPQYQNSEGTFYSLNWNIKPDSIKVSEWSLTDVEVEEPEIIEETTYEPGELVELKPDRIYDIVAEWAQDSYNGNADYIILTKKK